MMTETQKKRITKLRRQGLGYAAIATELKMPLGTVKTFCRRNGLQSGDLESDTQHENISFEQPKSSLISVENRGNTTSASQPESLKNTGFQDGQPVCEVTVSHAEEPDEGAVADVLAMLANAHFGR